LALGVASRIRGTIAIVGAGRSVLILETGAGSIIQTSMIVTAIGLIDTCRETGSVHCGIDTVGVAAAPDVTASPS
jgi:hypothetical protein